MGEIRLVPMMMCSHKHISWPQRLPQNVTTTSSCLDCGEEFEVTLFNQSMEELNEKERQRSRFVRFIDWLFSPSTD